MGLADRVTARISAKKLAQLTTDDGVVVDTAVLGYAVDDAIADIRRRKMRMSLRLSCSISPLRSIPA